jgi:hypothetical protein
MALDAWVLKGRPPSDPLHGHVAGCTRCSSRLAELEQAGDVFRREIFPATAEKVVARLKPVPWYRRILAEDHPLKLNYTVPMIPVIIVLCAVAFIQFPSLHQDGTYTGIKGGIGLKVFASREGAVRELRDGEAVAPGDMLRFVPAVPENGYLMVVSVEESGKLNLFHPAGGDASVRAEAGAHALPGSIILDESLGAERVFLLFSARPFGLVAVRDAAARALGAGKGIAEVRSLPLETKQATLLIIKKGR